MKYIMSVRSDGWGGGRERREKNSANDACREFEACVDRACTLSSHDRSALTLNPLPPCSWMATTLPHTAPGAWAKLSRTSWARSLRSWHHVAQVSARRWCWWTETGKVTAPCGRVPTGEGEGGCVRRSAIQEGAVPLPCLDSGASCIRTACANVMRREGGSQGVGQRRVPEQCPGRQGSQKGVSAARGCAWKGSWWVPPLRVRIVAPRLWSMQGVCQDVQIHVLALAVQMDVRLSGGDQAGRHGDVANGAAAADPSMYAGRGFARVWGEGERVVRCHSRWDAFARVADSAAGWENVVGSIPNTLQTASANTLAQVQWCSQELEYGAPEQASKMERVAAGAVRASERVRGLSRWEGTHQAPVTTGRMSIGLRSCDGDHSQVPSEGTPFQRLTAEGILLEF